VPAELLDFFAGDALLAGLLARRGIITAEAARAFVYPDAYIPTPPEELPELDLAVERILRALDDEERIGIWGDFDVDGQTSTSLLVGALQQLGGDVVFHIPLRREENHGVRLPFLERFIEEEHPALIITCDTGISAHDAAAYADARRVDWIITDHHALPRGGLPMGIARINPQRTPPGHPLHGLTGVGTAYKLIEAVCSALGQPEIAEAQLDLVALGTIADVGELSGENRYLVQRGMEVLRRNARTGLKALMAGARVNPAALNGDHIGFSLAPRMNALGRLDDAGRMVELMTTDNEARASQMALYLEGLNTLRKERQESIRREAFELAENNPAWLEFNVIILHKPDWEGGVVGIVANALVEAYGKPVVLLTGDRDGVCGGSARSIEGISLIDAINHNHDLLINGGGHAMAAGVSLRIADIEAFRQGMHRAVALQAPQGLPPLTLEVECELPLAQAHLPFAESLERLAPFGAGNPRPVFFTSDVSLRSALLFGREENHRKLFVADAEDNLLELIWWKSAEEELPEGRFDVAYTLHPVTSGGQNGLEALWVAYRQREAQRPAVVERPPLAVEDWRSLSVGEVAVRAPGLVQGRVEGQLGGESPLDRSIAYHEGPGAALAGGANRLELRPAETLLLYSIPPSAAVLRSLLETVQPRQLVLVCQGGGELDRPQALLTHLGGMVKYALNRDGRLPLTRLAAATGQREAVIAKAIEVLCAMGQCRVTEEDEIALRVSAAGAAPEPALQAALLRELAYLLEETRAFRNYLRGAALDWFRGLAEHSR
jgi:single-stranded-DNA-specific exonuclease